VLRFFRGFLFQEAGAMNGIKLLFVCMLAVLLGNVCLPAHAQSPEGSTSPKPTPKVDQTTAEKSAVAERSNRAKTESAAAELCQCADRDNNLASTKKIEQALAGPLHSGGLSYSDRSLQDVVKNISDEYGIDIRLDRTALEEAGIGTDSPVTNSLKNVSLRSALKLILRNLQLTWIIENEVLMVTTAEAANKHFDTCVYSIQGLVDDSDPKSVGALVEVIYACVATDTWAANGGGEAEVRPLPSGLLVVSHTPAVQEEVGALLNKIRKMREQVPLVKAGPHGYEAPPQHSPPSGPFQQNKKKD
jgi:hypothetical protein